MKVTICKEVKERTDRISTSNFLKQILPKGYYMDNGNYGAYYIHKGKKHSYNSSQKAEVWYKSKRIKVHDKDLYTILYNFGIKFRYKEITKCWEGCDTE